LPGFGFVHFERRKPVMTAALFTNTGISLIGEADWGTNICMFYETKDDLLKNTASYFEPGLANHLLLHGRIRPSLR
jgi:hypothetical protein